MCFVCVFVFVLVESERERKRGRERVCVYFMSSVLCVVCCFTTPVPAHYLYSGLGGVRSQG